MAAKITDSCWFLIDRRPATVAFLNTLNQVEVRIHRLCGNFIAREANWAEIVANTLALGFSLMAILVIAYSVIFRPDILATVGSVTSGITGVILGYYFNRERLQRAHREVEAVRTERNNHRLQAGRVRRRTASAVRQISESRAII